MNSQEDFQELKHTILDAIEKSPVGYEIEINFKGMGIPVKVEMTFSGGWKVDYTLIPGMPFKLFKGEGNTLKLLNITLLPNDGIREQKP